MIKSFKIIVSAIICLALLIAPMTVMAEEGTDYIISSEILTEGDNTYLIESSVPFTVYVLQPTEVGVYTVSASDCKIGIVSYTDMWVQTDPTEEIVNLNSVEWSCTDVNQAIMIAVLANSSEVNVSVSRRELDTSKEIPWTIYENKGKVEKFEMPSFINLDAFEDGYVDFEDSKIDDAVLGDDGYYHLNDKNGPVLFVNLNDSIMSMYTMSTYGRLSAIYYDDAGDVVKKVDYTAAFNEYVAALPVNDTGVIASYYYPLNADLIEMYKEIGFSHDWYSGDNAWVYVSDDAWLFACYFDEEVTNMNSSANDSNDDNGDNSINNTTGETVNTTTNNANNVTNDIVKSPATSDNVISVAFAMISATVVLIAGKKIK